MDRSAVYIQEDELIKLVRSFFERAGVDGVTAEALASTVVAAERDGSHSHKATRINSAD